MPRDTPDAALGGPERPGYLIVAATSSIAATVSLYQVGHGDGTLLPPCGPDPESFSAHTLGDLRLAPKAHRVGPDNGIRLSRWRQKVTRQKDRAGNEGRDDR